MSTSDVVAIVALVVAVTSFLIALAQVLQQYVATADGYRRCRESFLGPWAQFTRRKFHWTEFRFEVRYRGSTLFVAPPKNAGGPVPGAIVHNLDGTLQSRQTCLVPSDGEASSNQMTWLTLLSLITSCERDSRVWDRAHGRGSHLGPPEPPEYGVCMQLQSSERSWDFMPEVELRPFAHTTVGHLAEIAAMLGMRWITFEPIAGTLMASGNGMELISSTAPGQGIMVASFYITGRSVFTVNRMIPADAAKSLLFGSVPNIWNKHMNLGDAENMARLLLEMRCSRGIIEAYMGMPGMARVVDYNLLGMLADKVRLRGSKFRRLPNPTRHPYTTRLPLASAIPELFLNMKKLKRHATLSVHLKSLADLWTSDLDFVWFSSAYAEIHELESIHDILMACDQLLRGEWGEAVVMKVIGEYVGVLPRLRDEDKRWDSFETGGELMHYYLSVAFPLVAESRRESGAKASNPGSPSPSEDNVKDIWYTLILRGLCWWVLHEISEDTNTALPGQWKDSRSPVLLL